MPRVELPTHAAWLPGAGAQSAQRGLGSDHETIGSSQRMHQL